MAAADAEADAFLALNLVGPGDVSLDDPECDSGLAFFARVVFQ